MQEFIEFIKSPNSFVFPKQKDSQRFIDATQHLYKLSKQNEPHQMSPLDTLLVDNTDVEQLWEQIKLQNEPYIAFLAEECQRLLENCQEKDDTSGTEQGMDEIEDNGSELSDNDMFDSDNENDQALSNDSDEKDQDDELDQDTLNEMEEMNASSDLELDTPKSNSEKLKRTEVDDTFFSVREMENFAEMAEEYDLMNADELEEENVEMTDTRKKQVYSIFGGASDDEDDENGQGSDDDNANDIRYEDFFGKRETIDSSTNERNVKAPKRKRHQESEDDYYSDENKSRGTLSLKETKDALLSHTHESTHQVDDVNTVQSSFEKKQKAMDSIISKLEAEAVEDKHWVLKGEASSRNRPINSLLEEDLEVDYSKRPAPIITEDSTLTLEDMIKKRILDDLFDDVERKMPPKERNFDPNRKIQLNDEKSTKSLAQVYEDEFLKQKQGETFKSEKETALEKTHQEIQVLFNSICSNLDALSNWHFTPKELTADLEILPAATVPAISMEDALPGAVNVKTASVLAPKEIYDGKVQKAATEKDSLDKRRERNSRKNVFKKRKIEQHEANKTREKRVESNPNAQKEKAVKELLKDGNVTFIDDKTNPKTKSRNRGAQSLKQGDRIGEKKASVSSGQSLKL